MIKKKSIQGEKKNLGNESLTNNKNACKLRSCLSLAVVSQSDLGAITLGNQGHKGKTSHLARKSLQFGKLGFIVIC